GRKTRQRHRVYDENDPRHKANRRLNLMRINESAFFSLTRRRFLAYTPFTLHFRLKPGIRTGAVLLANTGRWARPCSTFSPQLSRRRRMFHDVHQEVRPGAEAVPGWPPQVGCPTTKETVVPTDSGGA